MAVPDAAQQTPSAEEICNRFEPSAQAQGLLRPEIGAGAFLGLLVEHRLYKDALTYVAHALPPRETVWWGCLCIWGVLRERPKNEATDVAKRALAATVRWVLDPSEANRREAEAEGRAATLRNPPGCLAMAAFWSGGSVAPPGLAEVQPEPFLCSRVVAQGVNSATKKLGRKQSEPLIRRFILLGMDVASGKYLWTSDQSVPT